MLFVKVANDKVWQTDRPTDRPTDRHTDRETCYVGQSNRPHPCTSRWIIMKKWRESWFFDPNMCAVLKQSLSHLLYNQLPKVTSTGLCHRQVENWWCNT